MLHTQRRNLQLDAAANSGVGLASSQQHGSSGVAPGCWGGGAVAPAASMPGGVCLEVPMPAFGPCDWWCTEAQAPFSLHS